MADEVQKEDAPVATVPAPEAETKTPAPETAAAATDSRTPEEVIQNLTAGNISKLVDPDVTDKTVPPKYEIHNNDGVTIGHVDTGVVRQGDTSSYTVALEDGKELSIDRSAFDTAAKGAQEVVVQKEGETPAQEGQDASEKEEGGVTNALAKNMGGIGGALLGALLGFMIGGPIGALIGLLLLGGMGSMMMDQDGVGHEMMGDRAQQNGQGQGKDGPDVPALQNGKVVAQELDKDELTEVTVAGRELKDHGNGHTTRPVEKNAEAILGINDHGQVEEVTYMKDGIRGKTVELEQPIQLSKDEKGDYKLGNGYNVSERLAGAIDKAREEQGKSTPEAQEKLAGLGDAVRGQIAQLGGEGQGQDSSPAGQLVAAASGIAKPPAEVETGRS